jgi:hypothetical protein
MGEKKIIVKFVENRRILKNIGIFFLNFIESLKNGIKDQEANQVHNYDTPDPVPDPQHCCRENALPTGTHQKMIFLVFSEAPFLRYCTRIRTVFGIGSTTQIIAMQF